MFWKPPNWPKTSPNFVHPPKPIFTRTIKFKTAQLGTRPIWQHCSAQHTLLLTRYANFIYLGFRRSLAYRHLSAVSPPSSVAIGGNWVCVLSSLVCNLYRLLVASLMAGLNIVPITENSSVMSRESSRGNISDYYRNRTRHHGGRRARCSTS